MMRRRPILVIVALFAVLFIAGPSLVAFYGDWLWFGELVYQSVYATILSAQALLFTNELSYVN